MIEAICFYSVITQSLINILTKNSDNQEMYLIADSIQ